MDKALTGTVIEVGAIECLKDRSGVAKCGLLIETTKEALRDFAGNLAYARVTVTLAKDGAGRPTHIDARPDHVRRAEDAVWKANEAHERARI